jgi:hypothetical protein
VEHPDRHEPVLPQNPGSVSPEVRPSEAILERYGANRRTRSIMLPQ